MDDAPVRASGVDAADEWQDRAYPYVASPSSMARWYRAKGFCSIERGDLELAAAEFVFSCVFEPSVMAESEIQYMRGRFDVDYSSMEVEEAMGVLDRNGVPIGPSDLACGVLANGVQLALDAGEVGIARECLADLYDLTGDEELVGLLEQLDEEIGKEG